MNNLHLLSFSCILLLLQKYNRFKDLWLGTLIDRQLILVILIKVYYIILELFSPINLFNKNNWRYRLYLIKNQYNAANALKYFLINQFVKFFLIDPSKTSKHL